MVEMGITSQPRRQPNTLSCPCCLRITVGSYQNCSYCGQELQPIPSQSLEGHFRKPYNNSETGKPGGFLVRFLALSADNFLIILTFIMFCLIIYTALEISRNYRFGQGIMDLPPLYLLLAFLVYHALYFAFFHGYQGNTPGMGIFRLKLVRINQQRLSYLRSSLRWFLSVSFGPLVLGFWWSLFSRRKQNFHDLVTGTLVIKSSLPDSGNR